MSNEQLRVRRTTAWKAQTSGRLKAIFEKRLPGQHRDKKRKKKKVKEKRQWICLNKKRKTLARTTREITKGKEGEEEQSFYPRPARWWCCARNECPFSLSPAERKRFCNNSAVSTRLDDASGMIKSNFHHRSQAPLNAHFCYGFFPAKSALCV